MEEKLKAIISERLGYLMKRANVSQLTLATELDTYPGAVNKWCRGVVLPGTVYIAKIAHFFHVSADYLLGLSNNEQNY